MASDSATTFLSPSTTGNHFVPLPGGIGQVLAIGAEYQSRDLVKFRPPLPVRDDQPLFTVLNSISHTQAVGTPDWGVFKDGVEPGPGLAVHNYKPFPTLLLPRICQKCLPSGLKLTGLLPMAS